MSIKKYSNDILKLLDQLKTNHIYELYNYENQSIPFSSKINTLTQHPPILQPTPLPTPLPKITTPSPIIPTPLPKITSPSPAPTIPTPLPKITSPPPIIPTPLPTPLPKITIPSYPPSPTIPTPLLKITSPPFIPTPSPKITTSTPLSTSSPNISIIDVYEYIIKNYPNTTNEPTYFKKFDKNISEECGKINSYNEDKTTSKNNKKTGELSSCDIITEMSGGGFSVKEYNDLYIKYPSKHFPDIKYDTNDENEIISLLKSIKNFYKEVYYEIILKTIEIDINREIYYKDEKGNNITTANSDTAIISKINTKMGEKIVIFGDHHGSFHTFMRNLKRLELMGILSLDTSDNIYKINDGYRLIFLGDIIDRGKFSLEIMTFLLKMFIKNNISTNLKLILIRGNHEEISINFHSIQGGFYQEINKKFSEKNAEKIYFTFNEIFIYFPSAIIINKQFWLCHGGIPIIDNWEKSDFFIKFIKGETQHFILKPINIIPQQIRWNDFSSKNEISGPIRESRFFYKIGLNYLKEFLDKTGLQFIIRGHQDNYANAYILKKDKEEGEMRLGNKNNKDIDKKIKYNKSGVKTDEDNNEYTQGPICEIYPEEISQKFDDVYPVLTISTNTDIGRKLYKDSFIILKPQPKSSLEKHNLPRYASINTGIRNFNATCYANSTIQFLRSMTKYFEKEKFTNDIIFYNNKYLLEGNNLIKKSERNIPLQIYLKEEIKKEIDKFDDNDKIKIGREKIKKNLLAIELLYQLIKQTIINGKGGVELNLLGYADMEEIIQEACYLRFNEQQDPTEFIDMIFYYLRDKKQFTFFQSDRQFFYSEKDKQCFELYDENKNLYKYTQHSSQILNLNILENLRNNHFIQINDLINENFSRIYNDGNKIDINKKMYYKDNKNNFNEITNNFLNCSSIEISIPNELKYLILNINIKYFDNVEKKFKKIFAKLIINNNIKINGIIFKPISYITHSGLGMGGGHYTNYSLRKNDKGQEIWVKYDDLSITEIGDDIIKLYNYLNHDTNRITSILLERIDLRDRIKSGGLSNHQIIKMNELINKYNNEIIGGKQIDYKYFENEIEKIKN